MKILVTGCAGFIGFHLTESLLRDEKNEITGIDNLNNYYDIKLKKDRLKILNNYSKFIFKKVDITNIQSINKIFKKNFQVVIHLAAQAGVRNSINNPRDYLVSNIVGHYNILDKCRIHSVKHFIYASSSSVYGLSNKKLLKEKTITDSPVSVYAATKKSNEIVTESFCKIYKTPSTAIRFFTVYGPYGRPDMAPHLFTDAISKNTNINLFNKGNQYRDFTYIDDVIIFIKKIINKIPKGEVPHRVINFGKGKSEKVTDFIKIIERRFNKKAKIKNLPMQKGDVIYTCADIKLMKKISNFVPKTSLENGLNKFIDWYLEYYKN
tara:strand:- start:1867 stop:2832 length:966 start_codon:yes stop_codon:yes gene_type:complete